MIVYIYKNSFCDPAKNIGTCRQFGDAKEVDDFINFFVASINPIYMSNWQIFITNDDVNFPEVDHFALFNEPLLPGKNRIKEVDVPALASQVNIKFAEALKKRDEARAKAAKLQPMGASVKA